MDVKRRRQPTTWLLPAAALIAGALILAFAPQEQTLGRGITSVYLHVSLIWAGMAALLASGALGLLIAVSGRVAWDRWAQAAGWVGLGFFGAGFGMSVVASIVNWGGVFWQEPRNASALNVMALALIVQVLVALLPLSRWRSLLHLAPAAILLYGTLATPLTLHPPSAARDSTSPAIQFAFLSLFLLALLAAGWSAWRLTQR